MTIIISMLVKASVLLAAAATMQALFGRRASAAMRHLLWTLTIVALLSLPILAFALPGWPAIETGAPEIAERSPFVRAPHSNSLPVVEAALDSTLASPPGANAAAIANPDLTGGAASNRLRYIALPAIYLSAIFLLLLRLAGQRLRIQRIAREATEIDEPDWTRLLFDCAEHMRLRRTVRLLRSVDVTMPLAFGVRRSAILVPAVADTWSEDRRRAVLVHELAHIVRHDCLTQILAAVTCAVYWPHPGVWWIARRLRVERELACDDCVLSTGASARRYATHLLELAYSLGGERAPAVAVAMAGRRHLETRLLAILDAARNRAAPAHRSRLVCAAVGAVLLVPIATATTTTTQGRQIATDSSASPPPAIALAVAQPAQEIAPPDRRGRSVEPSPGTWEIRPAGPLGVVQLTLTENDSSYSSVIDVERTIGLAPMQLAGGFGPVYFSLRRDAGSFAFEGFVRDGVGAGTYTFVRDPAFAADLAKRGFERPTAAEQRLMAREDIGAVFLDELNSQEYARPTIAELVRMAQHGVGLSYLREMGKLGFRLQRVEALVGLRDHGVTPEFIRGLEAEGFGRLTADDLVRARDHGIDPEYIQQLGQLGIKSQSLDVLITARDHGIDAEYVRQMRDAGYPLGLDDLKRVRDHGVDAEYIRGLADLGYQRLSLDVLVGARDRGIDLEYVREMRALGHSLTLEELRRARDHGVDPDYVRGMSDLGYPRLSLESLIRLRDSGVDPEFVRQLKGLGYGNIGIEDLIGLRNLGVTH